MKSKIILIIFVLACSDLFSQNILDKADKVWREIAEKSIYFDSVDSSQLKETFYAKIGDNTEMGNFMDALLYLQAALEDSHSKLIYKDSTISNFDFERLPQNTLEFYAIIQEQSGQIPLENNSIYSTMIKGEYAYILLLESDPMGANAQEYFNYLQDAISNLSAQKPKGWILDFRLNFGGAVFPMIAGLNSFIPNGKVFSWKDKWNNTTPVTLENGTYADADTTFSFGNTVQVPDARIAMLTSGLTASAGEQTVIAMMKNNSTSVIGESTFGYTTGIEILDLGDGLLFLYSSSYPVNFYDHDYLYHVVPDVLLEGGDNFIDLEKDAKVIEALKWFKAKK